MKDAIEIRGACQHNLKKIDVTIPRGKLVVITGLSGSGKSSLAFDTIYAEGQRKYVESLSAYARQFLEQMQKPEVESIEGLSPAISIEQRTAGSNPRSTVGTTTEIYDYLRLLYARIGRPHCYKCGKPIRRQTVQEIVDGIMSLPARTKVVVLAPMVKGRKGEHRKVLDRIARDGFVRARVDGEIVDLAEPVALDKKKRHSIEAVVDRLAVGAGAKERLTESVEAALAMGEGLMILSAGGEDKVFSELNACPECNISYEEFTPRMFSFNSPYGACERCHGLGTMYTMDRSLIVPDASLSIRAGAIRPWRFGGRSLVRYYNRLLRSLAKHYEFDLETPFKELPAKIRNAILHGSGGESIRMYFWRGGGIHYYRKAFEGVIANLERRLRETESERVKKRIFEFMNDQECTECRGARLKLSSLSVTIDGRNISEVTALSIDKAADLFADLGLGGKDAAVAKEVVKEIRLRLEFLRAVGLGYLTLDRASGTLSGGEAQRIRLATQIGSGLVGVVYILDEPSIGLHQKDNARLLETLVSLRDLGNTVIVVEHDESTIRAADYIIDLGPGAGAAGGRVVVQGDLPSVLACEESLTGRYLRGQLVIPVPEKRRPVRADNLLVIKGAREHNLKGIDVAIPLGLFCCITGVSGSGKSTLVDEILRRALFRKFYGSREKPGAHDRILGAGKVDKVIVIDQSPIGRTPRSNPATYTGLFDHIRKLYAMLPEARTRGYKPGRFSFNVKGGRCETCRGDGIIKIEMHFLPDVYVECEACKGKRYNRETLEIRYKGKSVADVLDMSVNGALEFFRNVPALRSKLQTISDVGLGYIKLGQSATTLSGGEAQRVKLSAELGKKSTGRTLYILDEPTTGLHFADIDNLLRVLQRLTDAGNSVLVIEHNLEVIKTADYIIDLGPGGGEEGGRIVAEGPPEKVARSRKSYTGKFLGKALKARRS